MTKFDVRIFERAERWTFDTTVLADSELDVMIKLREMYPPKHYRVVSIHPIR